LAKILADLSPIIPKVQEMHMPIIPIKYQNFIKKKSSYLLIMLLILGIVSCQGEYANDQLPVIDPITSNNKFDLLDYIESLEYIPLKENDASLLSQIVKMVRTTDQYIVKCHQRSSLFFYDLNGNFIKKLVATGEGPYQFSNLMDIAYDKHTNRIFLLDFEEKKILTYDINQNTISQDNRILDLHGQSLFHYKSRLYSIVPKNEAGRVKIFDDQSVNKINEGVFDNSSFNFIATQNSMNTYQDTLFICASFTDTIYYSINHEIKPYALLGKDNRSLASITNRKEYTQKYLFEEKKMEESEKKVLVPRGFFSTYRQLWFIELVWPNKMVIWDKENNIQCLIDFRNVKNGALLFGYQLFKIMYVDDNNFAYSSITLNKPFYTAAAEVIGHPDRYPPNIVNEVKKICTQYPEGTYYENPIIVKFKLNTDFTLNHLKSS